MNKTCFHCGLPLPEHQHFPVKTRDGEKETCCIGCQAVAQAIIDGGLEDYYKHRTEEAQQASPLPTAILDQLKIYDDETIQKSFVHGIADQAHTREAALILEGITCAACVWLNEQHLSRLRGVISVEINYSSYRARVRWDNSQIQLSDILKAIADIGFLAHPYDQSKQETLNQKTRKKSITRLWVAGLSMMQVMMYAVPVYLAPNGDMDAEFLWMLHWASFVLTLPVMLYSALPFYQATWRDFKTHQLSMDVPVTLGIVTTFIASTWALIHHIDHGIYFDSVSMFVFLLLGGRHLETMARQKAGEATENLVKLLPAIAQRVPNWPNDKTAVNVPASQLQVHDVIVVKAGETIPADAIILEGQTEVDESLMTGESRAIAKEAQDHIIAGSLNIQSPVFAKIEKTGMETRLAGIVRLLDKALAQKPKLGELADRFAQYFIGVLLLAAAISYGIWYTIAPDQALWIMVAVLVVSCPCALSLATPAALTAATGHLAQIGVLITGARSLETLAKITDVVFDKTGTLTTGKPQIVRIDNLSTTPDNHVLALAAALERHSTHPIALAFSHGAMPDIQMSAIQQITGKGVEGHFQNQSYRLGSASFIQTWHPHFSPDTSNQAGLSLIVLASEKSVLACFYLGDSLRPAAAGLMQSLKQQGLAIHLLSGDSIHAVQTVAQSCGIENLTATASPEDKVAYVKTLQAAGKKVLMLGDGINDAPVLAQADVSIAMGNGTDIAKSSGDMVLLEDEIGKIAQAHQLAQKTLTIIHENLIWAFAYNIIAIPLAMTGWITPWMASIGMASSSLLVVGNALRLLKRK